MVEINTLRLAAYGRPTPRFYPRAFSFKRYRAVAAAGIDKHDTKLRALAGLAANHICITFHGSETRCPDREARGILERSSIELRDRRALAGVGSRVAQIEKFAQGGAANTGDDEFLDHH